MLEPISLIDEGKVKRIRGLVTSAKVSPQITTRVVDKLREVFNDYIPDVWVNTDHYKKGQCGEQPGYAVSLTAETTTGTILTKDFNFGNKKEFILPEDLGERVAYAMLDEIQTGGCIDSCNQPTALLLMVLSRGDNACQLKVGSRVTQQSILMMRLIDRFFKVQFKIQECQDDLFVDDEDDDSDESNENEGKDKDSNGDEEMGEDEQSEDVLEKKEKDETEDGAEKLKFSKTFVFACLGISYTNIARKTD